MGEKGLNDELRAMQDIALALHQLDVPTRGRVLRWIVERFRNDISLITASPELMAAPITDMTSNARLRLVDESLSVESLTDLFPSVPSAAVSLGAVSAPQSLNGLLRDLVADVQGLAREWNGPESGPAEKPGPDPLLSVAS
jgi:hypothetical protein